MHSVTIELLQRACQAEGYYTGPLDGLRSPELERAMERLINTWDSADLVTIVDGFHPDQHP